MSGSAPRSRTRPGSGRPSPPVGLIRRYKGRQPVTVPDLPRHYDRYKRREISKAALARELGISRPTLDRLFAGYEQHEEARD